MNSDQEVLFWAFVLPMSVLLWGIVVIGAVAIAQAIIGWFRGTPPKANSDIGVPQ